MTGRLAAAATTLSTPGGTHSAVLGSRAQGPARVRGLESVRLRSRTTRDRAAGTPVDHGLPAEAVPDAPADPACTPGATPVMRGRSFGPAHREMHTGVHDPVTAARHAGPVADVLRTGLPGDLAGLGDVPTGRAAAWPGVRAVKGVRR
ncbi:hypothetical protein ABZT06_00080 [Streptomyces sp. NPDC005483]|uniref:hypothetical protein n=1 Tax=Streptomyces sp. NPDC005483 TaxID=3154882 RepID=UPI0033A53964